MYQTFSLLDLKRKNLKWFTPKNKKLFGDITYYLYFSKTTNKPYLINKTYMWSDVFSNTKKINYRIHKIDSELKINGLFDEIFKSLRDTKNFINNLKEVV